MRHALHGSIDRHVVEIALLQAHDVTRDPSHEIAIPYPLAVRGIDQHLKRLPTQHRIATFDRGEVQRRDETQIKREARAVVGARVRPQVRAGHVPHILGCLENGGKGIMVVIEHHLVAAEGCVCLQGCQQVVALEHFPGHLGRGAGEDALVAVLDGAMPFYEGELDVLFEQLKFGRGGEPRGMFAGSLRGKAMHGVDDLEELEPRVSQGCKFVRHVEGQA